MTEEQVLFVGGPFDGTTRPRRVGEEMIYLLVGAADEEPAIHRYGQADACWWWSVRDKHPVHAVPDREASVVSRAEVTAEAESAGKVRRLRDRQVRTP